MAAYRRWQGAGRIKLLIEIHEAQTERMLICAGLIDHEPRVYPREELAAALERIIAGLCTVGNITIDWCNQQGGLLDNASPTT
jgi:hypothetical protein